ncbi:hypothetical protein [Blastopirellula retiformator]|uniref:Uncharacterized protein n=1 Tax=Blastopirellula retiformator TaxID=2527970 RepID=A0A5C5V9E3_9BACT|nr:hypothetical protein [Blastopirellula retiformator]TWT34487.1 hypothetical protein Enr8_18960 [Blastopirellula retiformator]
MNSTSPEESPFASAQVVATSAVSARSRTLDTLVFVVNFSVAILVLASCIISVVVASNPFAFLGGLIVILPAVGYAALEWCCWYRRRHWLSAPLGAMNLAGALFFLFGLAANFAEMLTARDPVDASLLIFVGLACGLPAIYLGITGWRRLRSVFQGGTSAA